MHALHLRLKNLPKWFLLILVCGAAGRCFSQAQSPGNSVQPAGSSIQSVTPPSAVPSTQAPTGYVRPPATAAADHPTQIESSNPELTLNAGDLLDLIVYGVPELTLKTRITDQSTIILPLVGEMNVKGLTVKQFQDELAEKLMSGDLVLHPQISVLVTEFATEGISILGEVNQPGLYPLLGPHRLFDGIAAAGGLSAKAAKTLEVIHKGDPDQPVFIDLPEDWSARQNNKVNIELLPGDTVLVAKAGVIYVVGEVNKAGGFLMENNTQLTILQALALAQGATKMADMKRATLIRKDPTGVLDIPVPLDRILDTKSPDLLLSPDDILYIRSSKSKAAGKRIADAAVAGAAAAAIYFAHF
jgi:polysaccharide export outer membrane protein